jgi:hypothetical protein
VFAAGQLYITRLRGSRVHRLLQLLLPQTPQRPREFLGWVTVTRFGAAPGWEIAGGQQRKSGPEA